MHYIDNTSKPKIDVALKQTHILALNLSNVTNDKVALPSTVKANASVYEGTLTFDMKLNTLNVQPTFDLNAELKNTYLVMLNDFLKVYGNFDVHRNVSYCFQNTCNRFRLKVFNMIISIYYQNKQI